MIYELKMILRAITIIIGIALYVAIWVSLVKNWDECVTTEHAYPCVEKLLGTFYWLWMILHAIGVVFAFIWAWIY